MLNKTATREGQMELNEKVASFHLGKRLVREDNGYLYEVFPYEEKFCPQPFSRLGRDGWLREIDIPDYCNDLNACAEFEKTLTPTQCFEYQDALRKAIEDSIERVAPMRVTEWVWHATAEQRCRAFVATMEPSSVSSGNVSDGASGVAAKPRDAVGEQEEDLGEPRAV